MPRFSEQEISRFQRYIQTSDPFARLLEMRVVCASEEGLILEAPLRADFCNPYGIAHGGFLYAIADAAGGMTSSLSLDRPATEQRVVTIDGTLNFLHPLRCSPARTETRMVKTGRRVVVCDVYIRDGDGVLCVKGTFNYMPTDRPFLQEEALQR